MIVVSHPQVNAFNRKLVEALEIAENLEMFHTTLPWGRRAVNLPRRKVRAHPWPEVARLAALRLGAHGLARSARSSIGIDAVYRSLDEAVSRQLGKATAVYAYEDGALATFRAARDRGLRRFYELPIAYFESVQKLLREEAERLPAWAPTLQAPDDPPEKLARKAEELALADLIICPSRFVQSTLPTGTPSLVAEFGSPAAPPVLSPRESGKPLRLLFAGAMTQRKGLAEVFAALRILQRSDVELVVMGSPLAPHEFYRGEYADFTYEPPRPHAAVLELMSHCDALVLPSIVEGRALVQQEAMSRGLPLLVTANAGGEDLIVPGATGWLLPIRDADALAERIAWLADHREALPDMREAARRRAAECTWEAYTGKIIAAIQADGGTP